MTSQRAAGRMQMILDALCLGQHDTQVRQLIDAFGGEPVEAREYRFGEPQVFSRHLRFESGGEIVLHDGAVVAVILHVTATPFAPRGLDVAEWIDGVDNDATFEDFKTIFGSSWHFTDGDRCFTLDSGFMLPEFKEYGGSAAGDLRRVLFTVDDPKADCRPADEDCSVCRDLIRRTSDGSFDLDDTVDALIAAVDAGSLKEEARCVPLADLRPLHASALLALVESQATCTACHRVACVTLHRDSAPTFGHYPADAARRRPLEAIPPIEQWADDARIAAARDAMRYVDHEPASWFLVERPDGLYLDARYAINTMVDDSALVLLDESEQQQYRKRGHDYITELARRIERSHPYEETSPFYSRDLYRRPGGRGKYSAEVRAAIANYTWLAQIKQSAAKP
ncbi:hypothetical protein [Microbacterium sp.]|uniref:hypothetical protein n=1 Tax=Microbacterium sp. TaxID=51671 RepID=UPI003A95B192